MTVRGCCHEDCGTCDDEYSFDDVEVMQYTGCRDKDGLEIFEGDYLSVIPFESQNEFKCEVGFLKGSFCVVIRTEGYDYKVPLHELSDSNNVIEVLGNLYMNPELMDEMAE